MRVIVYYSCCMSGLEFSDMHREADEGGEVAEAVPVAPSDHEATTLVPPVHDVEVADSQSDDDLAERPRGDTRIEPYGQHDPHASQGTPHLDEAKELASSGERYHAFGNMGHDAKVAGAAALGGVLLFAVISSSGGPSVSGQERDTTQVAAAAEYSGGTTDVQSAMQDLNIERIPSAADPKDDGAVDKDIQNAEAEGAANMHGGSTGVTAREYAIEAFASDKLSGVEVPDKAKEEMTAGTLTEQSGGDPDADYMKAADSALGAADEASADGKTIDVPITEKK